MNPDPFSDTIAFLLQPGWTTAIFWSLMLASIAIAVYVFRTIPGQRSIEHVGNWAFRVLIGAMWWQQSLWKLPPYYTDQPQEPFGTTGLAYWMGLMGNPAAGRFRQQYSDTALLLIRPDRLRIGSADRGVTDPWLFHSVGRRHRGLADCQSVARSLQRTGRVALDLFLPVIADGELRVAPLRPQPWDRRHYNRSHQRAPEFWSGHPRRSHLTSARNSDHRAIAAAEGQTAAAQLFMGPCISQLSIAQCPRREPASDSVAFSMRFLAGAGTR